MATWQEQDGAETALTSRIMHMKQWLEQHDDDDLGLRWTTQPSLSMIPVYNEALNRQNRENEIRWGAFGAPDSISSGDLSHERVMPSTQKPENRLSYDDGGVWTTEHEHISASPLQGIAQSRTRLQQERGRSRTGNGITPSPGTAAKHNKDLEEGERPAPSKARLKAQRQCRFLQRMGYGEASAAVAEKEETHSKELKGLSTASKEEIQEECTKALERDVPSNPVTLCRELAYLQRLWRSVSRFPALGATARAVDHRARTVEVRVSKMLSTEEIARAAAAAFTARNGQ